MRSILKVTASTMPVLLASFLIGCGSGGGSGSHGDPGPKITSITLSPSSSAIAAGKTETFTAQALDQNGAALTGVAFTWTSSNAGVATIADGIATGVAAGTADITASSAGLTSNAATLTVTQPGAGNPTKPSESLIDDDLKAGKITEEQAFVYRVYAAFGSPSLPAAYQSAVIGGLDSPISKELAKRFSTLSPEAQAAIQPYLIPPIYKGSWGDPAFLSTLPSAKATPVPARSAPRRAVTTACIDGALPGLLPGWARKTTAHFNIWYRTAETPFSADFYTPADAEAAAGNIAAEAETVYNSLTGLFNKFPLSDALEACNGGDGAIDVYVDRMSKNYKGMTLTYPPGCAARPTWMWISPDAISDPKTARDIFAHEFMHMIDFAYGRGADCTDYIWLGEAAGQWAIDYVYPDDQFEQIGQFRTYAPCYYASEFQVPLDLAANRLCFGYSDYVFLFYMSHQIGPQTIKRIFESAELYDSLYAIDTALSASGGMKKAWPDFAVAGWNDWKAGFQDSFNQWDQLKEGKKADFDENDTGGSQTSGKSIRVELNGAPEKKMELNDPFTFMLGPLAYVLPRMSSAYVYLKFTDDTVRSITYNNKPAAFVGAKPDLKIQALMKINGVWKGPENWTGDFAPLPTTSPFHSFCRDAKAERLEELVVIYSNSDLARPETDDYINLDPTSTSAPEEQRFTPTVTVSNAGCWRWEGTSKVTTQSAGNPTKVASATAAYERFRDPLLPNGGAGMDLFFTVPGFGSASYGMNGPFLGNCTVSTLPATGPIQANDGAMTIRFNQLGQENNRAVLIGSGVTTLSVTQTVACPGPPPTSETNTNNLGAAWLQIPANDQLSADGQRISGHTEETGAFGGTTISDWDFHAVREQ